MYMYIYTVLLFTNTSKSIGPINDFINKINKTENAADSYKYIALQQLPVYHTYIITLYVHLSPS